MVTTDGEQDPRRELAFLITESQSLLHHASEALIRLFLAHAGLPVCPWLECAASTSFQEFRDELDRLSEPQWPQELLDDVAVVFIGGTPNDPDDSWTQAHASAVRLLRVVARRLAADKNLYNSVKHGMTIVPTEVQLSFHTEDGGGVTVAGGESVTFLEAEKSGKQRVWHQTTRWFNHENAMWLTMLVTCQIEALWLIAQARYTDAPTPKACSSSTPMRLTSWRARWHRSEHGSGVSRLASKI